MMMTILPEVKEALETGAPVVALESTIISHGLPYPENLSTAKRLGQIVREEGAVPATIAIIEGVIKIGLSEDDLALLAASDQKIRKVSRRDMSTVMAQKAHGATTVASTMICAQMAGISVFATGGIGGVHQGAPLDFDISADLPELARTNVAVVSAGPKAILDLPLTMEYLETQGVPVIGYGTDELPAFWSRQSGLTLHDRVDSAEEAAQIMKLKWDLGLSGGLMFANPVPVDDEIPADEIQIVITKALAQAKQAGISGKDVTPYVLDHIRQETKGQSLVTNQALVSHNAKVAAQIAVCFARLKR